MSEMRVPLDPLNPGHFFGCCGLFELFARTDTSLRGHFVADEATPRRAEFVLEGSAGFDLTGLLAALRDARYDPLPHPQKAIQPVQVNVNKRLVVLDWWLDTFGEEPSSLKCWAGQVTTAKLFTDLPRLIEPATGINDLFYRPALTKSKLGIDPRSAWNALDFGFSPDKHNRDSATYPIVEVLGALGLQAFRPDATRRDSIAFHLWSVPLPLPIARLAAFSGWVGLPLFRYEFSIAKRGQSYKFFTFAKFVERR